MVLGHGVLPHELFVKVRHVTVELLFGHALGKAVMDTRLAFRRGFRKASHV